MYHVSTLVEEKFQEILGTQFADISENHTEIFWNELIKCFSLTNNIDNQLDATVTIY